MTIAANTRYDILGTNENDVIGHGYQNNLQSAMDTLAQIADVVNGRAGDDAIETGAGNDLAAGDMLGAEWSLVDGEWVYDAGKVVVSNMAFARSYNDTIITGAGNDVLLGNGGDDMLISGAGNDTINAGSGIDRAMAGIGDDLVNLENGNDYAEGGQGADIINGGAGNDVIWGDDADGNVLTSAGAATGFSALAEAGGWTFTDSYGEAQIAQSAATVAGETYTIAFELAANLSGGYSSAMVEVLWNGEVVTTVEATSGVYETFKVDVVSSGEEGELAFRSVETAPNPAYDFSGPIVSYDKTFTVAGTAATVAAFAPGQSGLYQVIDGHLHLFDTQAKSYTKIGNDPGYKINAIGFNAEDDLIYGIAKSNGTDSLGNAVASTDIVMIDANGDTYRVGEGFYADYVGDFDGAGNLWTFHTALNRVSVVDVDARDADGNPAIEHFDFPDNLFGDRTYDLAYNAAQEVFMAVVAPAQHGGQGKVVKIDVSPVATGGLPTFTEMPITGTLYGDEMRGTMAKGAYGAVFFDGDGNLYYGLNRGDHDLDGATALQGGIFKVEIDEAGGTARAVFMSEAPTTGSNDGTVDPRSADAFVEVDADAAVLLRAPTLTPQEGGNDDLRGGDGSDEIHGGAGNDSLEGGNDDDFLFGDEGADRMNGGMGDDVMQGGQGNDKMQGQAGNDELLGGTGDDYVNGGEGADIVSGGTGTDKVVGGTGADIIDGGAGNDKLWGGAWAADGERDVFVFEGGDGRDFVFDFETGTDVLDLSAFDTTFAEVQAASRDAGWATKINLGALDGGEAGDLLILKGVDMALLTEDSFLL